MTEVFKNLALVGDVWVLYLLVLASVASVAVMIERALAFRRNKGDVSAFMDGLAKKLQKGDISGAVKLAESSGRTEAKVALEGLNNFKKGPASVEEVMTSRWIRERMDLEKNLVVLATLGNNAPFVGLFGTVLGIIKAFNDLAITGQSGIAVVMSGISSALIATALGILVAIPAVIANNYFATKLKQIQSNSESLSHIVMGYLKEKGK
jgi:biopolymer transport protein ExbB